MLSLIFTGIKKEQEHQARLEAERKAELARGGRFLRFPYTMSFVLLTLKRTSDIYFVRHNEPASTYGSKYAWINLSLGWWGIPFGPIYTLLCIGGSFKGEDITREVMSLLELLKIEINKLDTL